MIPTKGGRQDRIGGISSAYISRRENLTAGFICVGCWNPHQGFLLLASIGKLEIEIIYISPTEKNSTPVTIY